MQSREEKLAQDLRGPKELTIEEIRERLAAREAHPQLYLQARQRQAAIERDEQDRQAARDVWLRHGGNAKDFEAEWATISRESKRIQMLQEQQAARESFRRYGRERF